MERPNYSCISVPQRHLFGATVLDNFMQQQLEMVGDMSRATLKFDLSKTPFVRF